MLGLLSSWLFKWLLNLFVKSKIIFYIDFKSVEDNYLSIFSASSLKSWSFNFQISSDNFLRNLPSSSCWWIALFIFYNNDFISFEIFYLFSVSSFIFCFIFSKSISSYLFFWCFEDYFEISAIFFFDSLVKSSTCNFKSFIFLLRSKCTSFNCKIIF